MDQVKAITLDLDDTLWDVGPVIRRAEAELWAWLHERYPGIPEKFTPEQALALRADVVREHPERSHDLRFLRINVLERMARRAGYAAATADEAFAVFDAARNRVELYPDVVPALEGLADSFTLIAVTNGNADLAKIGIRDLFDDVVTAVEAGAAKPAPAIFERAIRRARSRAAETLHVGDHPEFDVVGAQRAGMKTAWLNRAAVEWPADLPRPDAVLGTLTELVTLLAPARERALDAWIRGR